MPNKPHAPRNGGSSSKKSKGPTGVEEDTSFIIFSNDKTDKKKNDAAAAKPGAPADNAPKGPTNKQIVGGASWTGKLPLNMLSEHCQKQKWEKPEYTMHKISEGFSSMVILKKKNAKSGEITSLPPLKIPPSHKHYLDAETAVEARNLAATWALFRVSSMKNLSFMLPPTHATLWKGPFAEVKKEDVKDGKGWMYEADPFAAQQEREKILAEAAKNRETRAKAAEVKASQPAPLPGIQQQTQNRDLNKGWKSAQKVEMGKLTRRRVEDIVRQYGIWGRGNMKISAAELKDIVAELVDLGFRKSHIEEAAEICHNKEEVIEWLLIHVPEDDLPGWSLPEGYVAGISLGSNNLKREGAVKRLATGGFPPELCEAEYDRCSGDERKAAQSLQDTLMKEDEYGSKINAGGEGADAVAWKEEQTTLASIYAEKYEKTSADSCTIHLEVVGMERPP